MSSDPLAPQTRVAAYGLCFDDADRLLLVRIAPGYTRDAEGKWTLPGGGLHFGEDPSRGVVREVEEETGYTVEVDGLAFVSSFARHEPVDGFGPYHGIRIVYHVSVTGGELRDELEESTDMAAWVSASDLETLPLVELVEHALEYLRARDVALAN